MFSKVNFVSLISKLALFYLFNFKIGLVLCFIIKMFNLHLAESRPYVLCIASVSLVDNMGSAAPDYAKIHIESLMESGGHTILAILKSKLLFI